MPLKYLIGSNKRYYFLLEECYDVINVFRLLYYNLLHLWSRDCYCPLLYIHTCVIFNKCIQTLSMVTFLLKGDVQNTTAFIFYTKLKIACLFNFRFSEAHLPTVDIVTKMMEPATCTSSDGADGLVSIKEEPNDDGPQTVLCYNQSDKQLSSQQHFADHKLEDCKDNIPILNITPIVTSDDCVSESEEDNIIVKSEPDDNYNLTETSNPTSDNFEVVPNVVPNLYEVKNEFPCTTQTEIVHNNRLDVGCEVIVVKEEPDCKPEIVDNVVVPGDVNIQTDEQYNDTVKEEPHTSMEICEVEVKEEHTLGELIIC